MRFQRVSKRSTELQYTKIVKNRFLKIRIRIELFRFDKIVNIKCQSNVIEYMPSGSTNIFRRTLTAQRKFRFVQSVRWRPHACLTEVIRLRDGNISHI